MSEDAGEAIAAFVGATVQDPRSNSRPGIAHGYDDHVVDELFDAAITAMTAGTIVEPAGAPT
ncbi:hypothetical protein J2S40_002833 [Nocardioides luteus]|uniref:hypothetical protein n=1 Tax=Nocardioides luteus TaxID=1844 RepID=UPI00166D927D|nr:hypothetical protein [Nocardioides luteus]MDR7311775.1 hypothetical protein [Nocardioides luteus]